MGPSCVSLSAGASSCRLNVSGWKLDDENQHATLLISLTRHLTPNSIPTDAPIVLMEPAGGIVLSESPGSDWSAVNLESNQDVIQQQQQTATIYCIYSANPTELVANSTRWFKDGQLLTNVGASSVPRIGESPQSTDARLTESTTATGYPVLTISQVQRKDAGLYECQVANSVGRSERLPASEHCRLEVNFRPSTQVRLYKPPTSWTVPASQAPATMQFQMADLVEVDQNQELVLPGASYVLICDVLEAQPAKVTRFHWLQRRPLAAAAANSGSHPNRRLLVGKPSLKAAKLNRLQLVAAGESDQMLLASLPANFTPSAYACAASNSLGAGEPSNQIELQLSYQPGKFSCSLT